MAISAIALGVSIAVSATAAQQSHASDVHAGQAKRDTQYKEGVLQQEALDKQKQTDLNAAQIAARQRQRAVAAYSAPSSAAQPETSVGAVGGQQNQSLL